MRRGGKRDGAGRPVGSTKGVKKKPYSTKLDAEIIAWLKMQRKASQKIEHALREVYGIYSHSDDEGINVWDDMDRLKAIEERVTLLEKSRPLSIRNAWYKAYTGDATEKHAVSNANDSIAEPCCPRKPR